MTSTDEEPSSPQGTSIPNESRCRYAYKECKNERSQRKNGKLHSLCEYHRRKANSVQKLYAMKRRNNGGETTRSKQSPREILNHEENEIKRINSINVEEETYYRLLEIKQRIQDAWERRSSEVYSSIYHQDHYTTWPPPYAAQPIPSNVYTHY